MSYVDRSLWSCGMVLCRPVCMILCRPVYMTLCGPIYMVLCSPAYMILCILVYMVSCRPTYLILCRLAYMVLCIQVYYGLYVGLYVTSLVICTRNPAYVVHTAVMVIINKTILNASTALVFSFFLRHIGRPRWLIRIDWGL